MTAITIMYPYDQLYNVLRITGVIQVNTSRSRVTYAGNDSIGNGLLIRINPAIVACITCNTMISRSVCSNDKRDYLAIRNSCMHIGLVVKRGYGRISKDKCCNNPSGVHEKFFADADLSTHIVITVIMGANE